MSKLNDQQHWLLGYFLHRHPIGIASSNPVPVGFSIGREWFATPGKIGMVNVRGLQRRGYVEEKKETFFSLTSLGLNAARHLYGQFYNAEAQADKEK